MKLVSKDNFENENFPWLTSQIVNIGNYPVLAMRVNFVGELDGSYTIQLNIKIKYLIFIPSWFKTKLKAIWNKGNGLIKN